MHSSPPLSSRTRRDVLVAVGMPIVRRLAARLARRLPASIAADDLIGAGAEGLLRAIAAYDPTRYDRFEPYAEMRIRGAMLDELRAGDPLTSRARRKMSKINRTQRALETRLGRAPTDAEVATALGIPLPDFQRAMGELSRAPSLAHGSDVEPDDVQAAHSDPEDECQRRELTARLNAAIGRLPARTQEVLAMYYLHERTQAEIGQVLGVTESRVCQILGAASQQLRGLLESDARPSAA